MHPLFAVLFALTQQWLVVSDLHVNPFDSSAQPPHYQEDTNWTLFDLALRQMRAAAPHAQVVVLDGDFLAHEFGAKVRAAGGKRNAQTEALRTMARIANSFGKAFPRSQFIVALGNNDDPCGDYRTAPDTVYLARLAQIWAPLVNRGAAAPDFIHAFAHDGEYAARLPGARMRALVVDDVPWSLFFRGCGRGSATMRQAEIAWFTSQLRDAGSDERDVVFLHIPPGIDVASTLLAQRFLVVPFLRDDVTVALSNTLHEYARHLAFVVAGHTHRSDFRIAGGVPMLVAPSISPVYSNDPAFLTVQIDRNATIRDYQMYSNNLWDGTWSRVLDFHEDLGVDAFTADNLQTLHARIPGDADLRVRWEGGLTGFSPVYTVRPVWLAFWCAQTELRGGYASCAGDQRRVALVPAALIAFLTAGVLLVVLIRMRLARQRRPG